MASPSSDRGSKKFLYIPFEKEGREQQQQGHGKQELPKDLLDKLLKAVGREALRERTANLQELEQALQGAMYPSPQDQREQDTNQAGSEARAGSSGESGDDSGMPLVRHLIKKGYLKDSPKWLSAKGFSAIGSRILSDVMKALKTGEYGLHETQQLGSGSLVMDTSKKYEPGDDIRLLNAPKSLLNTIQRTLGEGGDLRLPLKIEVDDFEEYETMQDVRVAVVYCIDLSSTMRYSSMYGDMSRIEAAKRALWSLYLLNRKFFPSDSVYIVGFGALASKVAPHDIPYLKTFEPGSDFLHYTNYQAAFRLASKLLQKDGAINK
ncbi:MAG: hypothetical protein ACREA4_11710, partial [Nitrososphaera sp.]